MTRYTQQLPAHCSKADRRSNAGFTLIEIMIALVIGLVLVSGMVSVFFGHKRTGELNEAIVEMQQSARFAMSVLSRDIRMAGFQGCTDPLNTPATVIASSSPTTDFRATAISGHTVSAAGALDPQGPTGLALPDGPVEPIAGSHSLVLQFGSAETHQLQPMARSDDPVVLQTANPGFVTGDLVLISNCQVADIFQVSGVQQSVLQHDSAVNSGSNALSAAYGNAGVINRPRAMRFESNIYFIADSGRTNSDGDSITSLYRQSLPYTSEPLSVIEGVEDFRLRFMVRADNNEITYLRADQIDADDAANIVSVQIGLLMQSHDRVVDTDQTASYWLAGTLVDPNVGDGLNSRRMRLAFNSTVRVRNRR